MKSALIKILDLLDKLSDFWFQAFNDKVRHLILWTMAVLSAIVLTAIGSLSNFIINGTLASLSVHIFWFIAWLMISAIIIWAFAIIMNGRYELKDRNAQLEKIKKEHLANQERLSEMVHKDMLTDLYNYKFLIEETIRMFSKASRSEDEYACLCYIDINDFKKLNDTYGHGAGDTALKILARTILKLIRIDDLAVHKSGDEFVIVWTTKEPDRASEMAVRIRNALGQLSFWYGQAQEIKFSAATGYYCCATRGRKPEEVLEELLDGADKNLYDHKAEAKS